MAAFTIYRSSDTSAPTLSGTAGALITVLDACLVNGYGSKAAAGWSKAFSGTNKAAYRAPSGARLYYRIQDDAPASATDARLRGFETMSDVDTGTGLFPTTAQQTNGLFIRKSGTADATARTWVILADARTCYVFIFPAGSDTSGTTHYRATCFGEFYSLLSNDAYNGFVSSRNAENGTSPANEVLDALVTSVTLTSAANYIARGHTGLGGSVLIGKHTDSVKNNDSATLSGTIPFTNPANGGLYVAPVWIHDPTTTPTFGLRGRMRGFWCQLHSTGGFTDGDTINGTGELAGKSFLFLKSSGNSGIYTMETSNTLETN